ncbi:hypothetical protein [Ramlibacter sp.]|uniref:hypothetical protein n=1 Tax=Ramlibacter sp. TaxID=1917967 RepID=UPI0018178848|nr:hypothetical protein [Ramlibacter sp.]MBA2672275.1 hypothetical protein [Ramlibacter sp.]
MNKKWLAVFVILAIALFAVSWLLPKTPAVPPQKSGFVSPAPVAAATGGLAGSHRPHPIA